MHRELLGIKWDFKKLLLREVCLFGKCGNTGNVTENCLFVFFFYWWAKLLLISKFKGTTKLMFCVGTPAGYRAQPSTGSVPGARLDLRAPVTETGVLCECTSGLREPWDFVGFFCLSRRAACLHRLSTSGLPGAAGPPPCLSTALP